MTKENKIQTERKKSESAAKFPYVLINFYLSRSHFFCEPLFARNCWCQVSVHQGQRCFLFYFEVLSVFYPPCPVKCCPSGVSDYSLMFPCSLPPWPDSRTSLPHERSSIYSSRVPSLSLSVHVRSLRLNSWLWPLNKMTIELEHFLWTLYFGSTWFRMIFICVIFRSRLFGVGTTWWVTQIAGFGYLMESKISNKMTPVTPFKSIPSGAISKKIFDLSVTFTFKLESSKVSQCCQEQSDTSWTSMVQLFLEFWLKNNKTSSLTFEWSWTMITKLYLKLTLKLHWLYRFWRHQTSYCYILSRTFQKQIIYTCDQLLKKFISFYTFTMMLLYHH